MTDSQIAVVIEDEPDARGLVSEVLEHAGFIPLAAGSGADGLRLVEEHDPLVTTLDVSLPGMDGFETARRIRAISSTYLIMLTARSDEVDALQGLRSGADDYVTKPFRPRELRARIEAMLRRPRAMGDAHRAGQSPEAAADPTASGWLEHHGLRMHPEMRLVVADGAEVELTRSEFDILHDLMRAGSATVAKEALAIMLRGERHGDSTYVNEHDARAIEVHMANLRRKLGESATRPRWIETVRGTGYRLAL
ncbi:response regulator transcription factor [Microbacterium suwonense]|uniref:Sensory transduction protein n=1 Tax=Microbacterium suwonense TaxID=683047 RepID=A0ABN6X8R0_9MICO|nr:response regulator transcription factor [Microbacterium suwonense]BDZ40605.1 putative sensory transduction protein [Microbacterium suwonense]